MYARIPSSCQGKKYVKKCAPCTTIQGSETLPVIIEDSIWTGSRVIKLPEMKMGKGSIIGVGAVIIRDVLEYSIVRGVHAKLIRIRKVE